MIRSLGDFDGAVHLLRGAFLLDHSVSVSKLGSLFRRDGNAPVQQLKRAIADAYGVAWSFPASCGTSPLNVLALLAVAPHGSTVLVNRDCHVSVHAAMVHGGYRPVYYASRFDPTINLPLGPAVEDVEAALLAHPDARCIVMTYPSYFGIAGDCGAIVELARARGIPVVVDAAHGAPLHFCSGLPEAAEDLGADVVLQSTHKTMGALSQGSVALFRTDEYLDPFYAAVTHLGLISTSFSYPTLSSIELSVARHQIEGEDTWRRSIDEAERFRAEAARIDGIATFGIDAAGRPGFRDLDRTRVTLDVSGTGLTGYEFDELLADSEIYAEMATARQVLFLFTPGTRPEDTSYLLAAVERVAASGDRTRPASAYRSPPPPPAMAMIPRDAHFAPKRTVRVDDALGAVSGETIAPYPPGCAVVAVGERLDAATLEYLEYVQASGGELYGASDPKFHTITIIDG